MAKTLLFVALVALAASAFAAIPSSFVVDKNVKTSSGGFSFVRGELGRVDPHDEQDILGYIDTHVRELAELSAFEDFKMTRNTSDIAGNFHIHFQEYFYRSAGLIEVDGGVLAVHIHPDGSVFALNGELLPESTTANYRERQFELSDIEAIKMGSVGFNRVEIEQPGTPVVFLANGQGYNAYRTIISYLNEDLDRVRSELFVCPFSGNFIEELPLHHPALNRTIYDAENGLVLPGTEVRAEGDPPSNTDDIVNQAYDNAGVCYDFYKTKFNRDSWDGNGAAMLSTVHYRNGYNNAFWNGVQMVYGDGDGVTFTDFAGDLSVVCHELTHAVVETTAGLRYRNESGALNEGMADIMGASAVVYDSGCLKSTSWEIGSECYIAGDALRYMNNPVLDGSSRDYYPDRYTGILDNGGVHWNSGIANLAYVLLTAGGVHPQQKTTGFVKQIGIEQSEMIFYSALANYMTETTDFAQAAVACETAAKELFGEVAANSAMNAWIAVGVNP